MYDLSRNGYSHDYIDSLLRQNREIGYEYDLLDKNNIPQGKITASGNIDFDSKAKIKRAASLEIREIKDVDFVSDRVRPYMWLKVGDTKLRFPLGIFLMSSPSRTSEGGLIRRSVECYDLTQILADDKFDTRYRVTAGTNYISAVSNILQSAGFDDSRLRLPIRNWQRT